MPLEHDLCKQRSAGVHRDRRYTASSAARIRPELHGFIWHGQQAEKTLWIGIRRHPAFQNLELPAVSTGDGTSIKSSCSRCLLQFYRQRNWAEVSEACKQPADFAQLSIWLSKELRKKSISCGFNCSQVHAARPAIQPEWLQVPSSLGKATVMRALHKFSTVFYWAVTLVDLRKKL